MKEDEERRKGEARKNDKNSTKGREVALEPRGRLLTDVSELYALPR